MSMRTKKEWQVPRILVMDNNSIESGGFKVFAYEKLVFGNGKGCGKTGTLIATGVGFYNPGKVCDGPGCTNINLPLSVLGDAGPTGYLPDFGLCS